jgi:hypothetical protein
MSSTYSTSLRAELIGSGDQAGAWGSTTNGNFSNIFDVAIAGYQTVSVTSASQALTYLNGPTTTANLNQSVYAMLRFTTTTGAAFNVYAPPVSKQYIVYNNSGYSMILYNSTVIGNTTAAGTGVTVTNGAKVMVWSDGTNFNELQAANLTGTLAVANGGTGVTTAAAVASLVGNLLFPVGALYSSTSATNPGTSLGFGTWTAFGAGRMLIGVGTSGGQTFAGGATGGDFAPALLSHTHTGTTGGQSANHTHGFSGTTSGVGNHVHTQSAYLTDSLPGFNGVPSGGNPAAGVGAVGPDTQAAGAHDHSYSGTTGTVSADHNHSFTTAASSSGSQTTGNLPPYVAVYMWQRTA